MNIKRKILVNKKTGQMMITLPKKKMEFFGKGNPKYVSLDVSVRNFEW